MNIDLDHNINVTSQTLTDTYKSLIASIDKSYHKKISKQCIKVLTQIRKVTMAMLKYILRDFPTHKSDYSQKQPDELNFTSIAPQKHHFIIHI